MTKQTKWLGGLGGIGGLLLLLILGEQLYAGHLTRQAQTAQQRYQQAQTAAQQRERKLTAQLLATGATNANPNLRALATQNQSVQILQAAATKFFRGYYTFNSAASYAARAKQLAPLMSQQVQKDAQLFDTTGSAGDRVVQALGLTAQFQRATVAVSQVDKDTIQGLVTVQYTAGYRDQTPGRGVRTYAVTYRTTTAKFTQIKLLASGIQGDRY